MLLPDKRLFRPEAIQPKLGSIVLPPEPLRQTILQNWVKTLATKAGQEKKETELLPAFLSANELVTV